MQTVIRAGWIVMRGHNAPVRGGDSGQKRAEKHRQPDVRLRFLIQGSGPGGWRLGCWNLRQMKVQRKRRPQRCRNDVPTRGWRCLGRSRGLLQRRNRGLDAAASRLIGLIPLPGAATHLTFFLRLRSCSSRQRHQRGGRQSLHPEGDDEKDGSEERHERELTEKTGRLWPIYPCLRMTIGKVTRKATAA